MDYQNVQRLHSLLNLETMRTTKINMVIPIHTRWRDLSAKTEEQRNINYGTKLTSQWDTVANDRVDRQTKNWKRQNRRGKKRKRRNETSSTNNNRDASRKPVSNDSESLSIRRTQLARKKGTSRSRARVSETTYMTIRRRPSRTLANANTTQRAKSNEMATNQGSESEIASNSTQERKKDSKTDGASTWISTEWKFTHPFLFLRQAQNFTFFRAAHWGPPSPLMTLFLLFTPMSLQSSLSVFNFLYLSQSLARWRKHWRKKSDKDTTVWKNRPEYKTTEPAKTWLFFKDFELTKGLMTIDGTVNLLCITINVGYSLDGIKKYY